MSDLNVVLIPNGTVKSVVLTPQGPVECSVVVVINENTTSGGPGLGDVVGPSYSVTNRIAAFNGTTGKLIKDGGKTIAEVLSTDNHTDGTTNKVFSATEKTKLAGIETGADVTDAANVGAVNAAATEKATPIDADSFPIVDSAASNVIKRTTFTNFKAFLKTYFDTIYTTTSAVASQITTALSGYLTSSTAASTYEPIKGADDNFVTDAEKIKLGNLSGTNTGDQTTIVGITGTKAQFDTAVTDGNIMYVGDAPTSHTHLLAAGATDVTASAAEVNILDGATLSTTELNYVDGVTSAIQTQLDARVFKNAVPCDFIIAASDETTALTTGTAKVTFRAPYAFTLTAVRASVTTAPTGGTLLTVDINESGTTVLSTKLTFDASEKTTTTAATAAVISDSAIADDAEITIDIDAVGSTIAGAGLKVYLIGTRSV